MKKFRQMNRTLQFFLVFLLLAVLTAVSFFALDYQKLKERGYLNADDLSIELYDEYSLFHIGKGGIVLNGRWISSILPVKKYDVSYDLDGIRHLTLGGGGVEITILQSDENRIHITSDAREIREERKDGTLAFDAGKKYSISCKVECKDPETLALVVQGGAIEFENDGAALKSLDVSAPAVEFRSTTERSYPVKIEGASVEGEIEVRENHYRVNLRATAVEWNGTDVFPGGKPFTKTFGTGKDALEISGTVIELSLND